jgi:hypothetical protein
MFFCFIDGRKDGLSVFSDFLFLNDGKFIIISVNF